MSRPRRSEREITKPRLTAGIAVFLFLLILAAWWGGYFVGLAGQAIYRWLYWR